MSGLLRSRSFARIVLAAIAIVFLAAPPALAKLSDREWKEAEKEFRKALASNDLQAIVASVKTIATDQSKRAVDMLLEIGAQLDNIKVYDSVKEALADMTEPEAVEHMIASLGKKTEQKQWSIRCVLCDVLSSMQHPGITEAIAKRLNDNVPYVVSAAAKALGKRRDKAGVRPLIEKLKDLERQKDVTWIDVRQALTAICGEDFESAADWSHFWDVKEKDFDPERDRGEKSEASTTVRDAPEFFAEPIISKRIMFVIDVSGSMREVDPKIDGKGGGKRVERVKKELQEYVKSLKPDVKFNILAFDDKIRAWKKAEQGIQPATPENKADAIQWVSTLKENGWTHTDEALKEAFRNLQINTIVLLSDGAPMRGKPNDPQSGAPIPPEEIYELVRGLNRLRGVKIHTFCFKVFEGNPQMQPFLDFMNTLAKENGGKMVLIP